MTARDGAGGRPGPVCGSRRAVARATDRKPESPTAHARPVHPLAGQLLGNLRQQHAGAEFGQAGALVCTARTHSANCAYFSTT